MNRVRIRRDGARVQVIHDGRCIDMPWQAALEVAGELKRIARLAEAEEKHEVIIRDTAILYRSGAPFGLSDDSRVKSEAWKEAQWGRDLRRYMPSVPSQEAFGTPVVRRK